MSNETTAKQPVSITVNYQYGNSELIDRQYGSIRTGDPSADMIICDL